MIKRLLHATCVCGWEAFILETKSESSNELIRKGKKRCPICNGKGGINIEEVPERELRVILGKLITCWPQLSVVEQYELYALVLRELNKRCPNENCSDVEVPQ